MNNFVPQVNHSLKYNSSIDGLRGVSIFLVLLFHIWPNYFSFGYVGVDVFFVLSGYLITQIIYTKIEDNNFSFKEFYRNRIRRIFPAMIIVVLTTLIIGFVFMFTMELEQLGRHIKSSTYFYQNFRLIGEIGYWDESAVLKPLLHFWSLSIEEQFYVFWPVLLVILGKLKFNIVNSLITVFIILFLLPFILEIDKFYHTISRAWELCFGGLIFVIAYKYKSFIEYIKRFKYGIFIFFILSVLFSYENSSFSTSKTFLIVVASGFLILLLNVEDKNKFFSNNILVFIGLISFPLYLWHYVFISYAHIFDFKIDILMGLFLIFISIIFSYLTFRYIEIYTRRQSSYKFALFLFVLAILLGFVANSKYLISVRSYLGMSTSFENQFVRTSDQNSMGISLLRKVLGYKPNNDYIKSSSDDLSKKYILVIGDSHAHTSYEGLANVLNQMGNETILLANSGCQPLVNGARGTMDDINECKEKIQNIYKFINIFEKNISKIIYVARGAKPMYNLGFGDVDDGVLEYYYEEYYHSSNNYDHKEIHLKKLDATLQFFNQMDTEFYFVLENPELGFHPKTCLSRSLSQSIESTKQDCKISYDAYHVRQKEYRKYVFGLSKQYKNIKILDPEKLFCDDKYCYAIKDGKMLYSDDDHLSVDGSFEQAKYFKESILNNK
ncbi:hypothetical protein CKA55_11835 [Arcobacter suis]|uniref:Acyltransferase n=1 Tax=Arcobacter suis CECT 7833 TaxID=663365 RepID=A0AAD0SRQ7_9BACT|nr:acyltransferase family protein [Arcobacter suis]AXX90459.1 acyltransferase [Arcobacter suis CECT 7833]RWS45613.1 hypothetical protein CKA55_11835 [Arcobacter suis]